jgi:hypothetical protein
VPGDGLAFTVLVSGQEELVSILERALELADLLALVGIDDVVGLEVVVDIDGELAEAALLLRRRQLGRRGQVADVSHAGLDVVARTKVALDRLRFGLRFDDDQAAPAVGHRVGLAAAGHAALSRP